MLAFIEVVFSWTQRSTLRVDGGCAVRAVLGGGHPYRAAYWFLMQIGMVLGFAASYPVNRRIIKRGIKEAV